MENWYKLLDVPEQLSRYSVKLFIGFNTSRSIYSAYAVAYAQFFNVTCLFSLIVALTYVIVPTPAIAVARLTSIYASL